MALFREIDEDESGIVTLQEFENFYTRDYKEKNKEIEAERQTKNTQNEIFDHLMKVLMQRGLTLQDCFDQIDTDKNNYIDKEEFQDLLERMGFTITEE